MFEEINFIKSFLNFQFLSCIIDFQLKYIMFMLHVHICVTDNWKQNIWKKSQCYFSQSYLKISFSVEKKIKNRVLNFKNVRVKYFNKWISKSNLGLLQLLFQNLYFYF